jgi:AraC-like DNA-binding protein
MRLHISTDDVPEADRFPLWHATVFNTLAISAQPMPNPSGTFQARFSARTHGPLLHCTFQSDGFLALRQSREIAHRQWDGYRIYREASAGVRFRVGGQDLVSAPGDLLIADADAPFEARPIDRYADESWLLPKALLEPHLPAKGRQTVLRLSGRQGVEALAASYLDSLTRNWDSIQVASMGQVTDTLARLIGIACGGVAADQPDAVRAGRLVEAKCYIDQHLTERDLSPSRVAASLGMSVRRLHLLFEPTGCGVAHHIQRRRLEECRAAVIGSPTRPIIDIAFAWGFSSLSTFYRAFQGQFGLSPSELRAATRGGPGP